MNQIVDFVIAALPWVVMGLFLAFAVVMLRNRKNGEKEITTVRKVGVLACALVRRLAVSWEIISVLGFPWGCYWEWQPVLL